MYPTKPKLENCHYTPLNILQSYECRYKRCVIMELVFGGALIII